MNIFKMHILKEGTAVKSLYCFLRGPKFDYQSPQGAGS